MKEELYSRLEGIAIKRSQPFCYSCYKIAPSGRCVTCGSDDLMRHLSGIGVEYGNDWVVQEILNDVEPAKIEELFEDSIRGCYEEETKIGWLTYDTVSAIKELDPVSWDLAKSEWIDQEDGETLVTFDNGGNYFEISKVEDFLSEHESNHDPK